MVYADVLHITVLYTILSFFVLHVGNINAFHSFHFFYNLR